MLLDEFLEQMKMVRLWDLCLNDGVSALVLFSDLIYSLPKNNNHTGTVRRGREGRKWEGRRMGGSERGRE